MDQQLITNPNMERVFWRQNQVAVTFHSDMPLISADGSNNASTILKQLNLEAQLQKLNQHLTGSGLDYTLSFFDEKESPRGHALPLSLNNGQKAGTFELPSGVHLYGHDQPVATDFGSVQTSIITCFNCTENTSGATASSATGGSPSPDSAATVVNEFNRVLAALNGQQVPISAASPVWYYGGTPVAQGCPLTPPIPLEDSCAYWHYRLPQLAPQDLQSMQGEGVTVFILDTLPEREVISEAVQKAGDDNLLLLDVSNTITYNYNFLSPGIELYNLQALAAGKDVYGHHEIMKMADHSLFIAGIIHDIAPKAKIEVIRVLDDYCVGDLRMFLHALQYIKNRMLPGGDLYQRPVVINMSLVFPSKEGAKALGLDVDLGSANNDVLSSIRRPIQCLLDLGAIITAAAGNDADLRTHQETKRPFAHYPAAFASPPYSLDGIIPVGAVDQNGKTTSYSCYPGARGIATYGGELPTVEPPQLDPNVPPVVSVTDAVRGIYTADTYPKLVSQSPDVETSRYPAPDHHAWASWAGTSFATPVITGVAARILEMRARGAAVSNVRDAIIAAAGENTTNWDRLDPSTGVGSESAVGPMLLARQVCNNEDEDEEAEVEIEVMSVTEDGEEVEIEVVSVEMEEQR